MGLVAVLGLIGRGLGWFELGFRYWLGRRGSLVLWAEECCLLGVSSLVLAMDGVVPV